MSNVPARRDASSHATVARARYDHGQLVRHGLVWSHFLDATRCSQIHSTSYYGYQNFQVLLILYTLHGVVVCYRIRHLPNAGGGTIIWPIFPENCMKINIIWTKTRVVGDAVVYQWTSWLNDWINVDEVSTLPLSLQWDFLSLLKINMPNSKWASPYKQT